ncbi:MAG: MOSC domain-containing protein [Alphaproteobacteria bacterium]|nr:MOSC domain-containing protein [Alphaproteobacteria bacterium]
MPVTITQLYRYPVKGLSAEPIAQATLTKGEVIPGDRAYAIENGTRDLDPERPQYFPKTKFLMLMRDERLATLETHFDDATQTLTIRRAGKDVARGQLSTLLGRQLIEQFLAAYMKDELKGPPHIVHAPGFSFSDVPMKVVSIINGASLDDLSRVIGQKVHPLRFRGNVYLEGPEPWAERHWLGKTLAIGDARLKVVMGIVRCAATNVNPETGQRDMNIPRTLGTAFGENLFGVYAEVTSPGTIHTKDAVSVLEE